MTLDECRAIANAVPDIVFAISSCSNGLGIAMTCGIDVVERLATELPVVENPILGEYLHVGYAYTRRDGA